MAEHVILFAGPMGAGKTTAIRSLSEIEVVSTEAANTERHIADKATTTVAMDYGEITLGPAEKVRLYGAPGQRRFDFMWQVLSTKAKGLVLLVNNDAPDPVATMLEYLGEFAHMLTAGAVVIGVTRSDIGNGPSLDDYAEAIWRRLPKDSIPVVTVDPRDAEDMKTALLTLVASLESRAFVRSVGGVR